MYQYCLLHSYIQKKIVKCFMIFRIYIWPIESFLNQCVWDDFSITIPLLLLFHCYSECTLTVHTAKSLHNLLCLSIWKLFNLKVVHVFIIWITVCNYLSGKLTNKFMKIQGITPKFLDAWVWFSQTLNNCTHSISISIVVIVLASCVRSFRIYRVVYSICIWHFTIMFVIINRLNEFKVFSLMFFVEILIQCLFYTCTFNTLSSNVLVFGSKDGAVGFTCTTWVSLLNIILSFFFTTITSCFKSTWSFRL